MEDPPESASIGAEDHHWLMVRGTCSVCSYTVSSDSFRTIDEKNRDDINKYFSTNIENGTICHPCYNEYERWRKESGGAEEENQLSFPFCYGVNASKDDHPTFDLTGSVSDGEAEETESEESDQDTLHDVNKSLDQAFMGMNSTDAAQMLNSLFANAKKDTPPIFPVTPTPLLFPTTATTTTPTHQPILPAPPPFTVPSLTTSTVNPLNLSSKIKKKSRPGRTPKDRLPLTLSATSATSDLSYLSTLKVSELQEQLKRYNASTKGSKAQLIQRLVRYICLFNTNRTLPNDMSYLTILRAPHINLASYSAADLEVVTAVAAAAAAEQEAATKEPLNTVFTQNEST